MKKVFKHKNNLIPKMAEEYIDNFNYYKFRQNNFRILLISVFLTIEQLFYGLFISPEERLLPNIFIITAFTMFIYVLISLYFHLKKPDKIILLHKIYEISIAFVGITIVLIRVALMPVDLFRIPAVFIAVIYGIAVIFYYSYKQSFLIYFYGAAGLILFLPIFKPELQLSNYIADTIPIIFFAWITSMVIYQKFTKEFINSNKIKNKNKNLKEKNEQIKIINDKLKNLSYIDQLTKAYNRRKINQVLSRVFIEAKRYKKSFSVIILDLDHFKKINDKYGHQTGDKVLKGFSDLLKENIREVDIFGRWGGEEFLIICPETGLDSAIDLAQRLRATIEKNIFIDGETLTASFGVAAYFEGDNIKNIIKRADDSLYSAKEKGRNRVESQVN